MRVLLLGGTADNSEYAERCARVKDMYETGDPRRAWDIARALRIDYIWVDRIERAAYPSGVAKFDRAPDLFVPAFQNSEVRIYNVR